MSLEELHAGPESGRSATTLESSYRTFGTDADVEDGPLVQTIETARDAGPEASGPSDDRGTGSRWAPPEVLNACAGALVSVDGAAATRIGVTSCHRGEGRSVIASALALIGRTSYERRTLLVELDLEHPSAATRLGLSVSPGVAELVREEVLLESSYQWTPEGVAVLTAGDPGSSPVAVLARFLETDLLVRLGAAFELLVVDLPPLEGPGTAARLARLCTTPLLVVRAGSTPLPDIRKAAALFEAPPPVILNGVLPTRSNRTRSRRGRR